tara:strand:- start:338 stop:538 length:201 start_codon:yes stop_codon:yes gene_type:complete
MKVGDLVSHWLDRGELSSGIIIETDVRMPIKDADGVRVLWNNVGVEAAYESDLVLIEKLIKSDEKE